ncbi:hypothetical protein C7435_3024 [Maricaulis maris]|uniref:TonB C-terminal domain-containing protein n=2 Tax=Maricaulis maris TaxID=74318 RepID=A0A495D1D2_9PROT|nr:hypothetical protein C7435_3024 [Maricaulis maris]
MNLVAALLFALCLATGAGALNGNHHAAVGAELTGAQGSAPAEQRPVDQWGWRRVCQAARAGEVSRMRELFEAMPPSGAYPPLFPISEAEICAFTAYVRAYEIDHAHSILLSVLQRGTGHAVEFGGSACTVPNDDVGARDRWVRGLGDRRLPIAEYLLQISERYPVNQVSRCLRAATASDVYGELRMMRRQLSAELALGSIELASQVANEIIVKVNEFTGCDQYDLDAPGTGGGCIPPGGLWIEWPVAEVMGTAGLTNEDIQDCSVEFEVDPSGEVLMTSVDIEGCEADDRIFWAIDTVLRTRVYLPSVVDGCPISRHLTLSWPERQSE